MWVHQSPGPRNTTFSSLSISLALSSFSKHQTTSTKPPLQLIERNVQTYTPALILSRHARANPSLTDYFLHQIPSERPQLRRTGEADSGPEPNSQWSPFVRPSQPAPRVRSE